MGPEEYRAARDFVHAGACPAAGFHRRGLASSILAAMRDGIVRLGGDPNKVNPLQPVSW